MTGRDIAKRKSSYLVVHVVFHFFPTLKILLGVNILILLSRYCWVLAFSSSLMNRYREKNKSVVTRYTTRKYPNSNLDSTANYLSPTFVNGVFDVSSFSAKKNNDVYLQPCHIHAGMDLATFSKERNLLENVKRQNCDGVLCDISSPICQIITEAANIKVLVAVAAFGFADPLVTGFCHIPNPLAYVPQLGLKFTNKMPLHQRIIKVVVSHLTSTLVHLFFLPYMFAEVNKTSLGIDSIPDLVYSRASFLLVNTDFTMDYPRPTSPTTKVTALKYATNVTMLFNTFSQLPYNVIWKYTEHIPQSIASNIKIIQWWSQKDLLGHSNTKALVTHCGLNNILEGAYHGVPMIGIPVVGDQASHGPKIAAKNVGVVLNVEETTQDDLYYAIINVTTRQDIIESTLRISKLIQNRPNSRTPVEEASDWMEYALNCNDGEYLRTEKYNISWHQFYLIDVFALVLVFLVIAVQLMRLIYVLYTSNIYV
ncbi:uncharacterized protein TRIADDRAFT_62405 [Trichoplax adhaerens]|uniref:Glucuronosyltransferase n=1 Tax=Trichoplax adhaerens TaxID=10228 RepID=B3SDP7_TRIAD|nr:hypothetical protein TRIADDRAFT_62405 [Trichoplax adhaerens]EDV19154.1 hypothetical protein TRIADDRAFT_62405 [Trichoplax adhaerens]|eukprot:XP_002118365.1 hypothetical protein TRIADDRAFT_62405 [Trichoplax adhaerens]